MQNNNFLVEIDSLKGRIVRTNQTYSPGDLICRSMPVSITKIRTKTSFQVSDAEHVELDEPARIFSHSCDWNMFVRNNEQLGYDFYASKHITPGDELTWYYGMTEAYSIAVETCYCGSPECLGRSFGFKEAAPHLQKMLAANGIAEYLLKWFADTGLNDGITMEKPVR